MLTRYNTSSNFVRNAVHILNSYRIGRRFGSVAPAHSLCNKEFVVKKSVSQSNLYRKDFRTTEIRLLRYIERKAHFLLFLLL